MRYLLALDLKRAQHMSRRQQRQDRKFGCLVRARNARGSLAISKLARGALVSTSANVCSRLPAILFVKFGSLSYPEPMFRWVA